MAVYLPALSGGFVFDDTLLVSQNPLLRGPLWPIWASAEATDYWPLTYTAFWLQWHLWGSEPMGFHLVNVALHAGAAVLLWRVLCRLEVPGAWLAGLLFAVHPVAVESVAWISELKNVLSGVLLLGSLLAWLHHRAAPGRGAYLAALGLFLLALLAKTSMVMLPVMLLVLAWWKEGRVGRRVALETAPFFVVALALGLVTVWFQQQHAMSGGWATAGWAERGGRAAWALVTYLRQAFVPAGLALVYPPWPSPDEPTFWAPLAAVVLGWGALLWWGRRRERRGLVAGLAWHTLMVLPVSGLVEIAFFMFGPMANHLQYLALTGPVALLAAGMAWAMRRWRTAAVGGAALIAVAFALLTVTRAAAFRDDVTLWSAAVRDAPQSFMAAWSLALRLGEAGRPQEAGKVMVEARERLRDPASRLRVEAVLQLVGERPDEAVLLAERAQELRPDPVFQLDLGTLLTAQDAPDQAARLLGAELDRQPRNGQLRYRLGSALALSGRVEDAIRVMRDGCRLSPSRGDACVALVLLLGRAGRSTSARVELAGTLGVDPRDPAVDAIIARSGVRVDP